MLKKISINWSSWVFIYFTLLFFMGFYFFEYTTWMGVIIVSILLLINRKVIKFNRTTFQICLLMIGAVVIVELISVLLYRYTLKIHLIVLQLIIIIIAFWAANTWDRMEFINSYISCMTWISIVSVITNIVYILYPSLIIKFPSLINSRGRKSFFLLFSIVSDFSGTGAQRNQGIFWEPGAFQAFLCLAYILELAKGEGKTRKSVLITILIAFVSTYSTTGIIVGALLLIFTFTKGKAAKTLIAIMTISFCLLNFLPMLSGYWKYTLIDKVDMLFQYQMGVDTVASSRMDSVMYPLKEWITLPMVGIGNSGYSYLAKEAGHSMFTCTPINWIVKYGLIYGGIVLYGIWRYFKKNFEIAYHSAIVFLIFLLSISTENFENNIIILIMAFQGYMFEKK